jgi:hypothetical protein
LLGNVKIRSFGKNFDQVSWNKLERKNLCRLKKLKNYRVITNDSPIAVGVGDVVECAGSLIT